MSETERLEMGFIVDGDYICDGCWTRPGMEHAEHRCHRDDGAWADPRQVCTCKLCT